MSGLSKAVYKNYDSQLNVALVAPYVFDASVKQIFASLLLGHKLYIVPEEIRMDGKALSQYYRNNSIDVSDGTPAHMRMLTDAVSSVAASNGEDLGVKQFLIGGEALTIKAIESFIDRFGSSKLKITNVYGPTECCVDTATFTVNSEDLGETSVIPIGAPLQNQSVYILGKNMEILPVGVVGELYIGGMNVGRGYINNPELTAEKFIPNPFINVQFTMENGQLGKNHCQLMYRTGDFARWLPDGNIEFIGRRDHQAKIRGFRIELEEIENRLLKHKHIKEAVVVSGKDAGGNAYHSAYIVSDIRLTVPELRQYLSDELPVYMIPSYFVRLKKLPLTANGKIDRKALPDPVRSVNKGVKHPAPRNVVEKRLAKIWKKVLGVKKIGIHDNFFELGGHSLNIMSMVSRIYEEFGVELPLKEVFKSPFISGIGEYISKAGLIKDYRQSHLERPIALLNEKTGKNIFSFPPIGAHGIAYRYLANNLEQYSFYGLNFIESDNKIQEYVDLITGVQNEGPYILLGYSAGGNLGFEVAKELVKQGHEVSHLIMMDSYKIEGVDTFTREIKVKDRVDKVVELLETQPGLFKYLSNQFIKDSIANKVKNYLAYATSLINSGQIDTKIYLIKSIEGTEDNKEIKESRDKWVEATTKMFVKFNGFGAHYEMINPGFAEENAKIIKEILK